MRAPTTPKHSHHHQAHADLREDHYHWLKDRENPEVIKYLKEENAYTESLMSPVKDLQTQIYQETLSRIQETDQDAPWPYRDHEYYFRTVEGFEHEIFCRRIRQDLGAPHAAPSGLIFAPTIRPYDSHVV